MIESIQTVPLDSLILSATGAQSERRKRFDQAAIAELAESIKAVGLLQPIVVRPRSELDVEIFEIVAGERRFLAAQHAGLTEISVSVRDLTDEQVLEVQLVENLQREGLHELVEAEGYEALMKQHGYTVEDLVAKVGKSRGYVYGRLKLLALGKEPRKAFFDGTISASIALLIARIPVPEIQAKALKDVTDSYDGVMSFRNASAHIHRNYMLELKDAPFPTGDDQLPGGACAACPKRTGNQRELLADIKSGDVCTDPKCFDTKRRAYASRRLEEAAVSGQKVIEGVAAKKIAPYGDVRSDSGYVALDDQCWQDGKNRTYRQILGKTAPTPALLVTPKDGDVVEVVPVSALPKSLSERQSGGGDDRYKREQASKLKKQKRETEFRKALLQACLEKVPTLLGNQALAAIAIGFLGELDTDAQRRVVEVLAWEIPKARSGMRSFDDKAIAAQVAGLDTRGLSQLLHALCVGRELYVSSYGDSKPTRLLQLAKGLKVNETKVRAALDAAEKAKTKKPTKTRKEK